jgi:hypothetical protein
MIPKPLPLQNAKELPPLTWGELSYGFSQGYVGWRTAVDFAITKMEEGATEAEVLDLAMVGKEDVWKIGDILARLATQETNARPSVKEIWLFILLRWLYENRREFQDPLMEVEEVYADFDYPEAISSFVRFLPPNDGYRPDLHTPEENLLRLDRNWRNYLDESNRHFC